MWLEAILTRDDLAALLAKLLPLTIDLGEDGDHISIAGPRDLSLVEGMGARVTCEAKVRWRVMGVPVPLTIHDVVVTMRPEIVLDAEGREVLAFPLFVEHADFAGIPTIIDESLTNRVNEALAARGRMLSWGFTEMLTRTLQLPRSLHPLETLSLAVAWGKVRVDAEAIVLAISLHTSTTREGELVADERATPADRLAERPRVRTSARSPRGRSLLERAMMLAGGLLALDLALRGLVALAHLRVTRS